MGRQRSEEELDRLMIRYMAEWRDELVLAGPPGLRASPGGRKLTLGRPLLIAALLAVLALGAAMVAGSRLLAPPSLIPAERGVFTLTGPMATAREMPSATLLSDGRVLVIGGWPAVSEAEIWEPGTETFRMAGSTIHPRYGHTVTELPDGRVLVVGGAVGSQGPRRAPAELWDPATRSFTPTGVPLVPRDWATARLLPGGRVLVTGGYGDAGSAPDEVWDPLTGLFSEWDGATPSATPAGGPGMARWEATATTTLLPDGRVLVAGGANESSVQPVAAARIWDPVTLTFSPTGSLVKPRSKHAAVLLVDGRVLLLGNHFRWPDGETAELFELR